MRFLVWAFRAFLFFTLFAFALNNSHEVVVRWFFGHAWRAPLVIVVLVAFGFGCALGVLAMVPAWWKHRRIAQRNKSVSTEAQADANAVAAPTPAMPYDGI